MSERLQLIDRLKSSVESRASYIRGKVNVLLPAQLHALRLNRGWTQKRFAHESGMKQSRVSAMEQPGAVNFNMETLIRSAAAYGVGLAVKFVPFSEMLRWENGFDQDSFDVSPIEADRKFLTDTSYSVPISVFVDSTSLSPKQGTYLEGFKSKVTIPAPLFLTSNNFALGHTEVTETATDIWSEGSAPIDITVTTGQNLKYERVANG